MNWGEPVDQTRLYYFYITAKHQHVTRAAEEIHIAQPSLTKAIKTLEAELGMELFYKKGRNIYLTAFGRQLKARLDNIFPLLEKLPEDIEQMKRQAENTVRLNVLAASTIITEAVIGYKKRHPHTLFEMIQNESESDCHVSVATNAVNLLQTLPVRQRCVMEEKIYLAVPRTSAYAQRSSVALAEIKDEEFVSLAGSRAFSTVCEKFCAYAGFKPRYSFKSDSPVAVRNIIGAGAGVGFWPEYSWGKTSEKEVALLPITQPECQRELIISLHQSGGPSSLAEEFYEYLVHFVQKKAGATPQNAPGMVK